MIVRLIHKLTSPNQEPLEPLDVRVALAALLVRAARADGDYAPEEVRQIDRILIKHHALGPFEATKLRAEAEALEAQAPDTVRFTRAIKEAIALEDRIAVIEALWTVVLEDDVRDEEENGFLRLVANLLGVNDRDSNLARQRVMRS